MAEQKVAFDDGVSTTLESWGTSGPAVICVHGITSSRKSWERTALALQNSFSLFAYDQRGHGDSANSLSPMTLQRSLDDLRTVAHEIGESAALIGHSWGGAVALLGGREPFAMKVVAIDPMVHVEPGTWRREYLDDTERDLALEPSELQRTLRKRLSAWHEKDVEGKLHAVRHMKADAIARLGAENRVDEGGWDLRNIVAGYPKPLLVLAAGPTDSVITPSDLKFIEAQGGPNVRVETFADQGHNLHRTAFDRYIAATSAFLQPQ
ncbi:MAG TPA: alpha/beta hydrolase [Candidatus Acidoferrales bacterium]|nr:alpha/beta hydrolase [Candidatus Acidoferrales bacterium]